MFNHNIPIVSMHGNQDNTVPYGSAMLTMFGYNIREVDGSHSMMEKCNQISLLNELHTWNGQDHCPQMTNSAYMDSSIWITKEFLYNYFFNTSNVVEVPSKNILVYPNPAQNNIFVKSEGLKSNSIEIIDITGGKIKIIKGENINEGVNINVSDLEKGIYFIKVGSYISKFVKN
jgi:hypothetical protein